MHGEADGHKVVIGHHSQETVIQTYKLCERIHLSDAAITGYNFAPSLDVPQHLWDGGRDETDACKGQVGEEEVHRGVEVGVLADSWDDE